ncbi:MAG: dTDP-4-amino-4,6-dideoxygalactose transaminase [Chitinophagales bacterium]
MIPFNKPAIVGNEMLYIQQAVDLGKLSGNGHFTQLCNTFFAEKYQFKKTFLTNSCTDALEMAALLCNLQPGDEVIIPSFTFPSCANAFLLRGAKIVFADCETDVPNIDVQEIEKLITQKTKAILVVHYAGIACNMKAITQLAKKHNLFLIEDCAHSVNSFYEGKPLGSFGHFAAFSFHETKNIQCGEGGMLVVNDERFFERAEILWEKGTNRVAFAEKKISKYNWIDVGSSFLMSELQAAYLFAQLEKLEEIQQIRIQLWETYNQQLKPGEEKGFFKLPSTTPTTGNNAHIFYLLCRNMQERDSLLKHLEENSIMAVFHYLPLHQSPFYTELFPSIHLHNTENFSQTMLRLPLYQALEVLDVDKICTQVLTFYN